MPSPTGKPLARGLSCLACRRKKQRCDAAKPECGSCVRAGRQSECIYTTPPRTKEQKMEDRLAALENILATATLQSGHTPDPEYGSITLTYPQTSPPPMSVSPKLTGPKLDSTLPPELSDHLIETFLSFAFHFDFPLSIPKFLRGTMYPKSDSRHPHPALINAIHLVACHWSDRDLTAYEPMFLERAQRDLQESLSRVDRLTDFLLATVLIARYSLYSGKNRTGWVGTYTATSAIITAETLGLHRLQSAEDRMQLETEPFYLLPPAKTVLEEMERINLWWSVYILSRNASLIGGDTVHLDDKNISTPWPYHRSQHSSGWVPETCFREDDTMIGLKAQASSLLHRAGRHAACAAVSADRIQQDQSFWTQHRAVIEALDNFRKALPPLPSAYDIAEFRIDPEDCIHGRTNSDSYKETVVHHSVIYAHTCELGARLQVHGILADSLETEHDLLLDVSHKVAHMASALGMFEPKIIHPFCATTWTAARRVLIRELKLLEATKAPPAVLNMVRSSVAHLSGAFNRLAAFFPRLRLYQEETDALTIKYQ